MSTGVLVQPHRSGGPRGPADCGCGRLDCHDDFAALAATADPAGRDRLRARLVEVHLNLAYSIAARYRRPALDVDDLRQVAALALVEAVNRFDPGRGTPFSAYAVPTVAGAMKRYFRDEMWVMQPPRRVKDLRLRIRAATDLLTQRLHHLPTVDDLAEHLDCRPEEIREAVASDDAMRPLSIDAPVKSADDDTDLASTLGGPDGAYDHLDDVLTLRPLLAQLSTREQRVVTMRYAGNLTQAQIAEQVGCSQMQVSRILRAALDWLRQAFLGLPQAGERPASQRPSSERPPNQRPSSERPQPPASGTTGEPAPVATAHPPAEHPERRPARRRTAGRPLPARPVRCATAVQVVRARSPGATTCCSG